MKRGSSNDGSVKKKADGRSPLHLAVEAAVCDVVRELLHDTENLNLQDQNGWTPLHSACTGGSLDVVELLLQQEGVSATLRSRDGSTPLHYLVRHFPSDPALCNLKEKEKEKEKEKKTRKSNEVDNAKANYLKICRLTKRLVKKGCDPCAVNNNGETALHHAAMRGKVTAVDFLLRKKKWNVDVNRCTAKYGETCLHFAVRSGSAETVDILLHHGADPWIKGSNGTVIDVALMQKKNEKILEVFHKHNINTTAPNNNTPHNNAQNSNNTHNTHNNNSHNTQPHNNFVFKTQEELQKEAKEKVEEIKEWMTQQMHLPEEYVELLVQDGFDDLNTIKLISEADLQDLGITKTGHRKKILHWAAQHPYIPINFVYH